MTETLGNDKNAPSDDNPASGSAEDKAPTRDKGGATRLSALAAKVDAHNGQPFWTRQLLNGTEPTFVVHHTGKVFSFMIGSDANNRVDGAELGFASTVMCGLLVDTSGEQPVLRVVKTTDAFDVAAMPAIKKLVFSCCGVKVVNQSAESQAQHLTTEKKLKEQDLLWSKIDLHNIACLQKRALNSDLFISVVGRRCVVDLDYDAQLRTEVGRAKLLDGRPARVFKFNKSGPKAWTEMPDDDHRSTASHAKERKPLEQLFKSARHKCTFAKK